MSSPEPAALLAARPLPPGWRWLRLSEVCKVVSGSTPRTGIPEYWNGNIPWVTPEDLGELKGPVLVATRRRITHVGLDNCAAQMLPPGTVLMSSRAPIGHLAVASVACCTNQGCKSLIPTDIVDSWYLFFALKKSVPDLKALGSGTTFTEISKTAVESFEIPIPPLSKQKRIAAILKDQMAAMEKARASGEAQLEAAKALPAAYLRTVFNTPEALHWPIKKLGEAGDIVSGITLGRKIGYAHTRSVPYLRVANVKDAYLDLSDVYQIDATEVEIEKLRLKFGDLLLTEGGDPDKLGRGTFWEEQILECIHQNHIFRVRFDEKNVLPQFVSAQIGSSYGKAYFLAHAKQTTGIATINQKVLAGFPLMVPPLAEQQRIVACLSEQMAAAEKARKTLEEQLTVINALPAVFLRRAFSGEL